MKINWPCFINTEARGFSEYCVIFDDMEDVPLLSRPRYLWFLGTLPEAERRRKMENCKNNKPKGHK